MTIVDLLARYEPEIFERLERIGRASGSSDYDDVLQREFHAMKRVSIDYAVMERAEDVAVVEAPFEWDDVGGWRAVERLGETDENGNLIDADRCVAVDEHGKVVDGDRLLGIIALDRLARGALAEATVVVSILSNGGLARSIEEAGGRVLRTPVGDKHIADSMSISNAGLGGEKSGHVIIREHTTSGDGIVTALEVLDILARSGRPLSELASAIPLDPQEQRTIRVRTKEWRADRALVDAVQAAEAELAGDSRIVVRPSGTEPALRVMVEGRDEALVPRLADELAALAGERLNQER